MGVIRRFVWGTMALGVLAVLGGTSALAFGSDPADPGAGEPAATHHEAAVHPVGAGDPSVAWRWTVPHTVSIPTR